LETPLGYQSATLISAVVGVPVLVALVIRYRHYVGSRLRLYFTEPGPAFDLAVFRILFYSTSFALLGTPLSQVRHFSELPDSLMTPPLGFGRVAAVLPISSSLVTAAFVVAVVTSVTGALGLATRASAILFAVGVFYYMTVPQLYGKVNHTHIVLWVAVLLAVSRTADTWSVDSVLRARRSALRGPLSEVEDSVAYSRPLRVTWLFLGLTYFLPGLFKYLVVGLKWASPGNMRGNLYTKWFELGGFRPPVPVDHAPLLVVAGLGTLFFEITYIFWLFDRRTRWISPVMGLVFHGSTNLIMRIGFYQSLGIYPSFVPWARLSTSFFRHRESVVVDYDDACARCRRSVAALRRLSLPGAVEFRESPENAMLGSAVAAGPTRAVAETKVLTHDSAEVRRSVLALVSRRSPALWPLLVLVRTGTGARLLVRHEKTPVDGPGPSSDGSVPGGGSRPRRGRTAPLVVGASVFGLSAVAAFTNIQWPVGVYPTFAYDQSGMVTTTLAVQDEGRTVDMRKCFAWMPSERLGGLLQSVAAKTGDAQDAAVRGLVNAASDGCGLGTSGTRDIQVERVSVSVAPGREGDVVSRSLLLKT